MAVQPIYQGQTYTPAKTRLASWTHRAGEFALTYWALIITICLGVIELAALSVPFLEFAGLDGIAKPIFYALHLICAQIPSHSFYIMGHQLGMCARNLSIYGAMFAGGLIFVLSKKRLPGIPWWVWLLLILPMAYDGLTQMVGLRESTWELRVLTGTLFGLANMWFALPLIQKTLQEEMTPAPALVTAIPPVQQQPAVPATTLPETPLTTGQDQHLEA